MRKVCAKIIFAFLRRSTTRAYEESAENVITLFKKFHRSSSTQKKKRLKKNQTKKTDLLITCKDGLNFTLTPSTFSRPSDTISLPPQLKIFLWVGGERKIYTFLK